MRALPAIAILTVLVLPTTARAAWGPSGSPICTASGFQGDLVAIPLPSGSQTQAWREMFTVWTDARDTTPEGSDVYFKTLVPWDPSSPPVDGSPVVIAPVFQGDPIAAYTGSFSNQPPSSGGVVVAWIDDRNGNVDLYAKRVLDQPFFNTPWPATGVPVCTNPSAQMLPQIVGDVGAGATLAWLDARTGFNSVYAQRLDANGVPQWAADGIPVCAEPGYRWNLRATAAPGGGMYLVWTDDRPGTVRAFAQRLQPDGTPAPGWPASGLQVSTLTATSLGPVVGDGAGGIYVTFDSGLSLPVATRIDGNGSVHAGWPADGVHLAATPFTGGLEDAIAYGGDGLVTVWRKNVIPPNDYFEYDLVAQRLLGNGTRAAGWGAEGNVVTAAAGDQVGARLVPGAPAILATWEDSRPGSQGVDVYAMRLTDAGAPHPYWPVNGQAIAAVNGRQSSPRPVWDEFGGVMIAYVDDHDFNSLESDIEVQRVTLDGRVGVTGVESGVSAGGLRLGTPMPNPARTEVSLSLIGNAGATRATVTDALGRRVRGLDSAAGTVRWDLADDAGRRVAPGVYWVHVRDRAGEQTRAVIVRK